MKTKDESYFQEIRFNNLGGALGINGVQKVYDGIDFQTESIESIKERFNVEKKEKHEKSNVYVRLGSANNFINKNHSYILGAFKTQTQGKIYYIVIYKYYSNPAESWLDR